MDKATFHYLYAISTFPVSLGAVAWMMCNSRRQKFLSERLGNWNAPHHPYLWFHGASVGEIQSLEPILKGLPDQLRSNLNVITSVSSSGRDYAARNSLGFSHLLPFDALPWLARPVRLRLPEVFVFGETELWPGLLSYLQMHHVPCCLVNARIRDGAWSLYQRFRWLFSPVISDLSLVCASDSLSAERLCALGADPSKVHITGNAKYDRRPPVVSPEDISMLHRSLFRGESRPLLILGSLHPGEEVVWLNALQQSEEKLSVIIAPRHMERVSYFEEVLRQRGLVYRRRTENIPADENEEAHQIVLLDTLGELESLYSFADAAFVGGTLIPLGGHNPYQPASYGVLPLVGPNVHRIAEEVGELQAADAVCCINQEEDARSIILSLTREQKSIREKGLRSAKVVEQYYGIGEKVGTFINEAYRRCIEDA